MRPQNQLIQPSEMVLAPSPRVVSPDLSGAGATVRLNTDAALAPARGMAAIGAAVKDAGEAGFDLSMKRLQAIAVNHENEADKAMEEAEGRIAVETAQEQDESKWKDIAQRHIAAARDRVSAIPMSKAAREAVMPKFDRWMTHRADQVELASTRQSMTKAAGVLNDRVRLAKENADPVQFEEAVKARRAFGSSNDAQDELDRRDFQNAVEAKKFEADTNAVITITRAQGVEAGRKYAEENGGDAIKKEKLLSAADSVHRDVLALKTEELSNAIASGQLTVPAEIDNWEPDNPAITPEVRAQYKAHLTRMNDAMERERQRANAPENMSRLVSEIQDLDPEKATDADFVRLDLAVQSLPEGYRRVPSQKLDAKLNRARSLDTPDGDVAELGDDILHSLFKSGSFGAYDNGTGKDSKGNPAIGPENGEVFKRDEAQYRAALTRKAEVGGKFSRWLKANPKATPEQVQKRIYEITGEPVSASLLDDLYGPAPSGPPSLGPVDITGELPTGTAGPPENILLPDKPQ